MPAYQDTPLATQQINQTQAPIRTNFQNLKLLIDVNHVDFADPINFGKHNVTNFIGQSNAPAAGPGGVPTFITALPTREFNIYNTVPNGNAVLNVAPNQGYPVALTSNELIVERALVAPETKNTFTPITATNQFNDATGQHGWAFLPSGILLKWGYVFANGAIASNQYDTFTYPINGAAPNGSIPEFNNVWTVIVGSTNNKNGVEQAAGNLNPSVLTALGDFNNTTIRIFCRATGVGFPGQFDWTYLSIGTAQSNT